MLLIMCTSMGVMNMVPWGGPLGRASAVTGISAAELWAKDHPSTDNWYFWLDAFCRGYGGARNQTYC